MGQDAPTTFLDGAIVWYRPTLGRGMVRLTGGRQFAVARVEGVTEIVPYLRVRVTLEEDGGRTVAVIYQLENGAREILEPPAPPPKKKRAAPRKKKAGAAAPRKKKAPAKKKAAGKAAKLKPKADGSLPVGMSVRHETFGQGFVVVSSPTVARVKFEVDERSVRVPDLSPLE